MKYINFLNLEKLNTELFYLDKGKYLTRPLKDFSELSPQEIAFEKKRGDYINHIPKNFTTDETIVVPYEKFNSGIVLVDENELILDADNEDSIKYIENLIKPFKDLVFIENTKKGKHYYLKTKGNFLGKKDLFLGDNIKIEIKGEGSHVFSSSANGLLHNYYSGAPKELQELTLEDTQYLFLTLLEAENLNLGYKRNAETGQFVFSRPSLKRLVEDIIKDNTITPENLNKFASEFKYTLELNDYQEFTGIYKGQRDNALFKITTRLCRCLDIESVEVIKEFISIINSYIIEPSFSIKELSKFLNSLDKQEGYYKNWTSVDKIILQKGLLNYQIYEDETTIKGNKKRENLGFLAVIKQNINDSLPPSYETYQELNNKRTVVVRHNVPDRTMIKTINNRYPELAKQYIRYETYAYTKENIEKGIAGQVKENREPTLNYQDIMPIHIINDGILSYSPNELLYDGNKLNYGSTRYSTYVINSRFDEYLTPEIFLNRPYMRVFMENLFDNNIKKAALFFSEIYNFFNFKRTTDKIFAFLGPGGIGKDTLFEFISKSLFNNPEEELYTRSQDEVKTALKRFNKQLVESPLHFYRESTLNGIDVELINLLNNIVGNYSIKKEGKGQNEDTALLRIILVGMASNTIDIDLGAYNNTRFVVYKCPGYYKFRGHTKLDTMKHFYGEKDCYKSRDELWLPYYQEFCNFVIHNSYFYDLIKNEDFRDICDLKLFEDIHIVSSPQLDEFFKLLEDFKSGDLNSILEDKKDLKTLPTRIKSLKRLLYAKLWTLVNNKNTFMQKPEIKILSLRNKIEDFNWKLYRSSSYLARYIIVTLEELYKEENRFDLLKNAKLKVMNEYLDLFIMAIENNKHKFTIYEGNLIKL